MRLPHVRLTVRRLMAVVAVVAILLAVADWIWVSERTTKYRRRADWCEGMEKRCRQIDAMEAKTRAAEAQVAFGVSYQFLNDPTWNRQMILYFEALKKKYDYAAKHPRDPVPPDPPNP